MEVTDEFLTAANTKRPGYQQILGDLRAGQADWDSLVVRHLDRLSRSIIDSIPVIEHLRDNGKGLVSVTQNLDLSTPTGRAMLWIILTFAQWEREMLGERVKSKMVSIAEAGGWPPGKAPFGYKRSGSRHDNVLVIEPRKAQMVRDIFRRYADGESVSSLARAYHGTPGLTKNSILNALRNRIYIGAIVYDSKEYPGQHKPLVSEALYEAAQSRLPAPKGPRPNAQKYPYLLTGLLRCHCGRYLTANTAWNRSRQYPYYRCTDTECKKLVPAAAAERTVLDAIASVPFDVDMIRRTIEEIHSERQRQLKEISPELEQVDQALRAATDEQAQIEHAFLAGLVTVENKDHWNGKLAAARKEIESLEGRRRELHQMANADLGIYADAATMAKGLKRYANVLAEADSAEEKRNAILALVKRIDLQKDGTFAITYADGLYKRPEWLPRLDSNQEPTGPKPVVLPITPRGNRRKQRVM